MLMCRDMQSIVSPMDVATSNTGGIPAEGHPPLAAHRPPAASMGPPSAPASASVLPATTSRTGVSQSGAGDKKSRGKNFSLDESTQLARSWINVSEDPKVGAYQTGATFWTRVFQHYHQNRLSHWPERYASLTILHLRLATKHCFSLSAAPPLLSKISSRQCPLRCPNLSLPLNKLRTM